MMENKSTITAFSSKFLEYITCCNGVSCLHVTCNIKYGMLRSFCALFIGVSVFMDINSNSVVFMFSVKVKQTNYEIMDKPWSGTLATTSNTLLFSSNCSKLGSRGVVFETRGSHLCCIPGANCFILHYQRNCHLGVAIAGSCETRSFCSITQWFSGLN